MSVLALVNVGLGLANDELVVAVGTCGDFGIVEDDRAAQIAFAIVPLSEEEAGAGAGASSRYLAVLPRVAELLERPERFERQWGRELAELVAGREAIGEGGVSVSERLEIDLAVVERHPRGRGEERLPGASGGLPVHRAAVHSVTPANRIIAFDGERCECYLRYESWVRTVSRRVPLRPDLGPLAARLTAEEPSGRRWVADGVGAIVPRMCPAADGRTEIEPARVVSLVSEYLASAEPAWDPWRPESALIPTPERGAYRGRYGGTSRFLTATPARRRRRL